MDDGLSVTSEVDSLPGLSQDDTKPSSSQSDDELFISDSLGRMSVTPPPLPRSKSPHCDSALYDDNFMLEDGVDLGV